MPSFGFGNVHQSEAIPNTLPKTQNVPLQVPHHLYAEQLSGTAFTRPRACQRYSWLYRQHPSVVHDDYQPSARTLVHPLHPMQSPNPLRWSALQALASPSDFLSGLCHVASNAHAHVWLYQCDHAMSSYFSNHDGELLFIPIEGQLRLKTEFGELLVEPEHIAVIPRGVFFTVEPHGKASGYLCENKSLPFMLPELGLMGANALANPRHFQYPDAAFESTKKPVTLVCKYQDHCFEAQSPYSPLNVVAWQGNLAPYTYALTLFNTINTVSFDHPDPSIFTVLTSPSDTVGVANLDFILFPPRWMVAEHSFRPPYFHRNVMSELMGLVWGKYEGKHEGFEPGGISIHNAFTPHGPDHQTYKRTLERDTKPVYLKDSLAFMFESCTSWQTTELAMNLPSRQLDYTRCWAGL